MKKFLQDILNDKNKKEYLMNLEEISYEKVNDMFEDYRIAHEKKDQIEFNELVDFQTNMRGVKIRGTYDTYPEAKVKADRLRKRDSHFHVYIGQVGYWLPWDPEPGDIENQEYQEPQLNELMKEYKKNQDNKDALYEELKNDKVDQAKKETEHKKKEMKLDIFKEQETEAKEKIPEFREILDERDRMFLAKKQAEKTDQEKLDDDPLGSKSGYADPWMQRKAEEEAKEQVAETDDFPENSSSIIKKEETNVSEIIKEIF